MTPQERAEKIIVENSPMIRDNPVTKSRLTELIRVAIIEATNDEIEKRRAAEAVIEILTQRLGYIASVAAPGEEDDRQPTLAEGEDKPPEPELNLLPGDTAQRLSDELRAMGLSYNPEYVRRRLVELMGGDYKPAEPHVWHDRTKSKQELKSAQCFCWSCRKHRGEVPDGPG